MRLRPGLGATYRVQLGPDRSFGDTARLVPYLAHLGIETIYCSPVAEAVPGSTHGYDGTDPTSLREELGGENGYEALVSACAEAGLGICVDIVPNHLATWPGGPWWRRLLAEGRESDVAPMFDIAWDVGVPGQVALPLLDRPLEQALADALVQLGESGDGGGGADGVGGGGAGRGNGAGGGGVAVLLVGGADLPLAGGRPRTGESVADVLAAQHYRLVDWHDGTDRNYRRFFDIDGLVGVRVETPDVFDRTHALVVALAQRGWLSSVRVDHVDGLRDPAAYLHRLAAAVDVPVVVEKILSGDEPLPPEWPVAGTTGYEAIDDLGGALVDPDGLDRLVAQARDEGEPAPGLLTVETRRFVAGDRFPGELARLARLLDTPADDLAAATCHLTRYRTYLDDGTISPADVDEWRDAATRAGVPALAATILDPVRRPAVLGLQQLTGAIMAKGVEDTAWYRLAGPLAFCEVGGEPDRDRRDGPGRFHRRAAARAAGGRAGLVPGTTHDTKRAQDVRCRLYALTELADRFEDGLRELRRSVGLAADGGDLAFESRFLAQLVLGILPPAPAGLASVEPSLGDAQWPAGELLAERLGDALRKSAREAKLRSSWTDPDVGYEDRLRELGARALADRAAAVHAAFGSLAAEVARLGAVNSLSSVVLRSALPGTPDCYQGDEAWDLSLVDPDNRRPVDFDRLSAALLALDSLDGGDVAGLRRSWPDGRVKLLVTSRCLRARARARSGVAPGAPCVPLPADGPAAGSVLALARRGEDGRWLLAVTTRLPGSLTAADGDLPAGASYGGTRLALPAGAPARFDEVLADRTVEATGGSLPLDQVLADLPVGLLLSP
ncbi:MAG: malto-oligosyltrehalose synthase [Acidimicrobiales bacterium]